MYCSRKACRVPYMTLHKNAPTLHSLDRLTVGERQGFPQRLLSTAVLKPLGLMTEKGQKIIMIYRLYLRLYRVINSRVMENLQILANKSKEEMRERMKGVVIKVGDEVKVSNGREAFWCKI